MYLVSALPGDKSERNMQGFTEENADQSDDNMPSGPKASLPSVPTLLALDPKPSRSFDNWGTGAKKPADNSKQGAEYISPYDSFFDGRNTTQRAETANRR